MKEFSVHTISLQFLLFIIIFRLFFPIILLLLHVPAVFWVLSRVKFIMENFLPFSHMKFIFFFLFCVSFVFQKTFSFHWQWFYSSPIETIDLSDSWDIHKSILCDMQIHRKIVMQKSSSITIWFICMSFQC